MGPKKGRRVRKIEVLTDSVPEFKLGGTTADTQQRREEREAIEKEDEAQKQRKEARREAATHSPEEGVVGKRPRTGRSETELDPCTEGGGQAGITCPTST